MSYLISSILHSHTLIPHPTAPGPQPQRHLIHMPIIHDLATQESLAVSSPPEHRSRVAPEVLAIADYTA